jgi:hypothetical protein
MTIRQILALCTLAALFVVAACDASDTSNGPVDPRTSTPGASAARTEAAPTGAATAIELTASRLDALERGFRKEVEAVRAAQDRARSATTPRARGEAIQAGFEDATMALGARAAGMPIEEYRHVREVVNETLRTLDYQGKVDGPLTIDLSRVDEATRARLSRDPLADLSPASAAALRTRIDRLVPIWLEYVRLTAVAG